MRSSLLVASPRSLSLLFILTSLAGSSTAPWQTQIKNAVEESMYTNMPPTIFSPSGRLYSVERKVEAASNADDVSSNVVAAIACEEGIVIVSCRTQSPHLDDDNCTETTSLLMPHAMQYQVGPQVYAATGGNAADSQILKDKILQISSMLWERCNGGLGAVLPLPPALLARHVADHLQRPTQQISSGKILAVSLVEWVVYCCMPYP
jgi:20S proteasome alpha/beta subunit